MQFALHLLIYMTLSEARPQIVQAELRDNLFHSRGKQEVQPNILEVQHNIQLLQQNVILSLKQCFYFLWSPRTGLLKAVFLLLVLLLWIGKLQRLSAGPRRPAKQVSEV